MNDIINSFINGQNAQMLRQVHEEYNFISEFVQAIQDSEELNDKQKITILGRVLKSYE